MSIIQRITEMGFYYRREDTGQEHGPFTVEDESALDFDVQLASKLGVDAQDVLKARLLEISRSTTFAECAEILGSTIRHDTANKIILLCANLLTFTSEDQFNVQLAGESSAGKSYTALESMSYFPEAVQMIVAGASPKAFMHDVGRMG